MEAYSKNYSNSFQKSSERFVWKVFWRLIRGDVYERAVSLCEGYRSLSRKLRFIWKTPISNGLASCSRSRRRVGSQSSRKRRDPLFSGLTYVITHQKPEPRKYRHICIVVSEKMFMQRVNLDVSEGAEIVKPALTNLEIILGAKEAYPITPLAGYQSAVSTP